MDDSGFNSTTNHFLDKPLDFIYLMLKITDYTMLCVSEYLDDHL